MFSTVEYLLWPVLASDVLRVTLSEILHLLAELARTGTDQETTTVSGTDTDSWCRRISQKVTAAQALIESAKFESSREGELDNAMASTLLSLKSYVTNGSPPVLPNLEGLVDALLRSVSSGTNVPRETAAEPHLIERLAVF